MSCILSSDPIPTIANWLDIIKLSRHYSIYQKTSKLHGCPFKKIGMMMIELGILLPREEDYNQAITHMLDAITTVEVVQFVEQLSRTNRAPNSILHYLRSIKRLESFVWDEFHLDSLFLIKNYHIDYYYRSTLFTVLSSANRRKQHFEINNFYRWARGMGFLKENPLNGQIFNRQAIKINICSESQYLQLRKYIQHKESNPEYAFYLSLLLFYGFKTEDIAKSQLNIIGGNVGIKLRRKKLTRGKKYYCRKEILILPDRPVWFKQLQQRFLSAWEKNYTLVKKSFPQTPLVLPRSHISNRFASTDTLRIRIKEATIDAAGAPIPAKVLRQTCGHLYTTKGDASILSTMGWSEQFSFHYTWLPRQYYISPSETDRGNPEEEPRKG